MLVIDQSKNYSANFGAIYRTSAIFYKDPDAKLTLSFMDYWKHKNNISAGVILSVRDMSGNLLTREELNFDKKNVINYAVDDSLPEGSVEIEAFSSQNLRIPYAAIMGVYETESSICMVHTYTRNHSLHELDSGNSITNVAETCWTLSREENIENYAIYHNGHTHLPEQEGTLKLLSGRGIEREMKFNIKSLRPYETYKISLEEIIPDYKHWEEGQECWVSVHFPGGTAFSRLLLIRKNTVTREIQATHSNFDYSHFVTNKIDAKKPAYMKIPDLGDLEQYEMVVYPRFSPGDYKLKLQNEGPLPLGIGGVFNIHNNVKAVEISSDEGSLPSRIVTGLRGGLKGVMPFECSLGIVHEKRPPKRFHWLLVSKTYSSRIFFCVYDEIYESNSEGIEIVFKLYNSSSSEFLETKKTYVIEELKGLSLKLDDIFHKGDLSSFASDAFVYLTVFSHYGGFFIYSSLKKNNSLSIEHSF